MYVCMYVNECCDGRQCGCSKQIVGINLYVFIQYAAIKSTQWCTCACDTEDVLQTNICIVS